jgi:hypothetical protein
MTLLDRFGLTDNFSVDISDPALLEGNGTTTFVVGKRTPYQATINGTAIPCYVTLREAKITRMSLLEQQQLVNNTKKNYWLATMIMKPVKFDVELVIDGNTMSLQQFLNVLANEAAKKEIPHDEFLLLARRIGFNFDDGMPLFVQQFGASFDGFKNAVDAFKAAGAKDVINTVTKTARIKAVYAHETGVPVTSLELGTVDRSKSPRNQGFENLVSAQIEQFVRITGLRKEARILQNEVTNSNGWSQEKIKTVQAKIDELKKMSRQWVSSWSGAQQRIVNDNGIYTPENQYDPVNAPCGRFTMVVGGNPIPVDLWTNSARANNATVPVQPATLPSLDDDEDPI